MNRYLRGIGAATIGTFKFLLLKAARNSKVKITLPTFISSNTEVSVDKGGQLCIGRHFNMRNGSRLTVRSGGNIVIGDNFYMNTGCIVSAHNRISIGNNVEFGPGVLVYDQDHDFRAEGGLSAKKFKTSPVVIGNNVWIGANSIILRGTNIGDNSVIGAGSIVKGDIPANKVLVQRRENQLYPLGEK